MESKINVIFFSATVWTSLGHDSNNCGLNLVFKFIFPVTFCVFSLFLFFSKPQRLKMKSTRSLILNSKI